MIDLGALLTVLILILILALVLILARMPRRAPEGRQMPLRYYVTHRINTDVPGPSCAALDLGPAWPAPRLEIRP